MHVDRYVTGTTWESEVGYCRAIRTGAHILVSGTVGLDADGRTPHGAYAQAVLAMGRVIAAVEALGGSREDIVRTRMFATDPQGDLAGIAQAHREAFGAHPPATSLLGVAALVGPEFVIEVEAEAHMGASLSEPR